jgi:hypothetical protein
LGRDGLAARVSTACVLLLYQVVKNWTAEICSKEPSNGQLLRSM